MKTRLEWFNELPSNVSEKAIKNTGAIGLDLECDTMSDALSGGFPWIDAPEGWKYWANIRTAYDRLEMALASIKELEHA